MFAGVRRNMTLGFPDHLTKWELSDAFREAYLKDQKPIPHEIVDDGPIFENIVTGDAIDVTKFPSPVWHELDGGRYIGTGTYSITRDPEENWLNAGAYRAMVHDKTSVGMLMAAGHHAAIHCEKYFKRGEPMPVAMVLGGDPLCFFYGGLEAPYGVFEIDVVGGLRGKADEDGEGQGHRPAVPGRRRDRAGRLRHAGQARGRRPVRRMDRPLCRRRQALHRARRQGDLSPQRPDPARRAADGRRARRDGALPRGDALGHHQAEHRPTPACRACSRCGATRSAARGMFHGIAIKQRYPGHAVQAGHIAAQCGASAYASKYIVVVDDDVDVTNLDHLMWAMLTRTDPKESIQFIEGSWDSPADPRLSPEKRAKGDMTHSVADHRRLPAVVLARQVPADQHAERRGGAQGARRSSAGCWTARRLTERNHEQRGVECPGSAAESERVCCCCSVTGCRERDRLRRPARAGSGLPLLIAGTVCQIWANLRWVG